MRSIGLGGRTAVKVERYSKEAGNPNWGEWVVAGES
jgi:hypothetical protein